MTAELLETAKKAQQRLQDAEALAATICVEGLAPKCVVAGVYSNLWRFDADELSSIAALCKEIALRKLAAAQGEFAAI